MNKKTIIRWKIYIDRARMYISYITFVMIVFMFLNQIENEAIKMFIKSNEILIYPITIILFLFFCLILGRIDTKYGFRKEEMKNNSLENPIISDIWRKLNKIESKINENNISKKGK